MRLYIMRHGEAVQAGPDVVRPLTAKGRADVVKMAHFLQSSHSPITAIWHSSKVRAIETAGFVSRTLGGAIHTEAHDGLNPDDSVEGFFESLKADAPENLLLVSHLPFVGSLVGFLVSGSENVPVAYQTAAIVALEGSLENGFIILWAVHPDCLP